MGDGVDTRTRRRLPAAGHPKPGSAQQLGRRHDAGVGRAQRRHERRVHLGSADPATGEPVELLWVKGSGGDLGTLTESGLAVLRLDRLRGLATVYRGVEHEDEMVAAFDYALHGKGGAAPSIDTAMHGLVDAAHVDHLHPDAGIALATASGLGDAPVTPGTLAEAVRDGMDRAAAAIDSGGARDLLARWVEATGSPAG